jgi:hypothetical protein
MGARPGRYEIGQPGVSQPKVSQSKVSQHNQAVTGAAATQFLTLAGAAAAASRRRRGATATVLPTRSCSARWRGSSAPWAGA